MDTAELIIPEVAQVSVIDKLPKKTLRNNVEDRLHTIQHTLEEKKLVTFVSTVAGGAATGFATPMVVDMLGKDYLFITPASQLAFAVIAGGVMGLTHPVSRLRSVISRLNENMTVPFPPDEQKRDPRIALKTGVAAAAMVATTAGAALLDRHAAGIVGLADDAVIVGASVVSGMLARAASHIPRISESTLVQNKQTPPDSK